MAESIGDGLEELPRPWVLVLGFDEDSDVGDVLRARGVLPVYVDSLAEVRPSDFDFLIARGPVLRSGRPGLDNLDVLQFQHYEALGAALEGYPNRELLTLQEGQRAARFELTDSARDSGLEALLSRTVLATTPRMGSYRVYAQSASRSAPPLMGGRIVKEHPFYVLAREVTGYPLAGYWENAKGRQWWILPVQTTDYELWVEAMLTRWSDRRPDAFPPLGRGSEWRTHAEEQAHSTTEKHKIATANMLREREEELALLEDEERRVSEKASADEQRLLYGSGEELVDAVSEALQALGFTVFDADAEAEKAGTAKKEDLRVSLESRPTWVCLCEVKGKKRAAATGDLDQLEKAMTIYASRNGGLADAGWYIVNANREQQPSTRPRPLGTSLREVQASSERANTAVIDTRELFVLVREVQAGRMSKELAQRSLAEAREIYTAPENGAMD